MLFSLGHGQRIAMPSDAATESGVISFAAKKMGAVAPGANVGQMNGSAVEAGLSGTDAQSFGYMFPDAAGVPGSDAATVNALEALAAAMVEASGDPADANSDISPIMTYFGQFIDHDITANTDRDVENVSEMTGDILPPQDRATVVTKIVNLRNGSLQLDSLYGEGPSDTPFTAKVRSALRDPSDRAKMRLGEISGPIPGFQAIPLPADGGADLPRLKQLLDDPASGLTQADIDALPSGEFKDGFSNPGRAMIGDGRNDENLLVAQLHLAFLRFHNAMAEELKTAIPDDEMRFVEAKKCTTWVYQWLVVNVYLPKVCMPSVVDGVKAAGAPLYKSFRDRVGSAADELPLPLEFSVAAFRFGHSMVRAEYDHNRNFGRPADGGARRATFRELFAFTGGGNLGEAIIGSPQDKLASNWPIEWDRFAKETPDEPDQRARKIDTKLAPPLSVMLNATDPDPGIERILKHLAERNLRRSHRLNIPTGQEAVVAVNAFDASSGPSVESSVHQVAYKVDYLDLPAKDEQVGIAVLTSSALGEGAAGQALSDGGMLEATPLWFYVLKEAEVTAGDTLGPLGSRIVAETLIGLVVQDSQSYWNEGAGGGAWTPAEVPVGGQAITDFPKMLASCGLMA